MDLKPTNDVIFKKLFGEPKNKDLLQDFVEAIFPELQIKSVKVNKDVSLTRKLITEKLGILDVVAVLNDDIKLNIEMQVKDYYNTVERSLFYATGMVHEELDSGDDYIEMPQSISVWLTTYDVLEEGPFHERAVLKRDFENRVLTEKFALHYIQLSKFKKECQKISSKLDEWLTFILNEDKEAIRMMKNEKIKKAEEELEYLTGDEATRRIAELRAKGIRDEKAALSKAKKEGIEAGTEKSRLAIAKKMLENNEKIELIIKYTGLTEKEIQKLK